MVYPHLLITNEDMCVRRASEDQENSLPRSPVKFLVAISIELHEATIGPKCRCLLPIEHAVPIAVKRLGGQNSSLPTETFARDVSVGNRGQTVVCRAARLLMFAR